MAAHGVLEDMASGAKSRFVPRGPRPLADILGGALTPVCRRRGFASVDLISHWPDIVGPSYARTTSPDRLVWPRRPKGLIDEEEHQPADLSVRCTSGAAFRLIHEMDQVVERINTFFGYRLVGRIRILALPPVSFERPARPVPGPVSDAAAARVDALAAGIEDAGLRAAVARLGRAVAGDRASRPTGGGAANNHA